jgi:hypothetical protein
MAGPLPDFTLYKVNVGTNPDDGTGDTLRAAFVKLNAAVAQVWTYLQAAVVIDDGSGTFWMLIADTAGNLGTRTNIGPATAAVVLDDGASGFWQIEVNTAGLRGVKSVSGPATAIPTIVDSSGGSWQPIVDSLGNLGLRSV